MPEGTRKIDRRLCFTGETGKRCTREAKALSYTDRQAIEGVATVKVSEEFLEKLAAEVMRLLKGDISDILQASALCAEMSRDLDKVLLPLFRKKLGMSEGEFSRKVGIDRISKYGKGHTDDLPTKFSVLYRISCIPHPEIEKVLRSEPFTRDTTANDVFRIAKQFNTRKFAGPFKLRRRGISKASRRR